LFEPNTDDDLKQRKVLPGDFLILVRSRGPLFQSILKKLTAHNLPVAGSDRLLLLDELVIKDLISLLKFLTNSSDDLSLAEVLRSPLLGLSEEDLFKISYGRASTLFEALKLKLPKHKAIRILDDLTTNQKFLTPYELVERILIDHSGRLRMTARLGPGVNEILDEFLLQILNYEEEEPPSTYGFLCWLSGIEVAVKRQLSNNSSSIRVMTIHGSKGLESPIVIIRDTSQNAQKHNRNLFLVKDGLVCLSDSNNNLPDELKNLKELYRLDEIEEENRLFYVAITRAKNWLIIGGVGKDQDSLTARSWYFLAKKAFKRLENNKKLSVQLGEGGQLVYDYSWTSGNGNKNMTKQFNDNLNVLEVDKQLVRTKKVLFEKVRLSYPSIKHFTVSDIVKSVSEPQVQKLIEGTSPSELADGATLYGSLVHTFLQYLPSYLSHDTEYLINLIYHKFRNQLDQTDLVYRAYNESLAILERPELSFLFNNDNSLREVPIAGNISLQDMTDNNSEKGRWIKGRIDLLNITATQILIVDFKTNYNVPKSVELVSSLILSQLELYTLLLEQAYPNHEVSAAILWTHQAQLMKIPRDITQSALNTIFINQVLDDV